MAVINLTLAHKLQYLMAELKNTISQSNLFFSYSIVTALISLTWWFGVRITTMQSEINVLNSNHARLENTITVVRTQMITRELFDSKMENLNLKLDQALGLNKNK